MRIDVDVVIVRYDGRAPALKKLTRRLMGVM
jgi:hypothetical protein